MPPSRKWLLGFGFIAAASAAGAWLLWPRPPEAFPLAELVPGDATFYAGFRDYRELESLRTPWAAEIRGRIDRVRPHLAGPVAVYLDRSLEWVALARLTRVSSILAGAEVVDGAAAAAQSPEALARHKARETSLADLPEFKSLGSRIFVNLRALKPAGRLHDFSALGLEVGTPPISSSGATADGPLQIRGRALYRPEVFRTYLEWYVQAPRQGLPRGTAPFQAAFMEHFPRLWDEVTHNYLEALDAEKAEREASALSRDFLQGRSFRDFLGRLGPACGIALVPTPYPVPALVVWIDLPDEETRTLAMKMVHRAINDSVRLRRERGLAPALDVSAEGSLWKIKFVDARAIRLGDAFSPAYTFRDRRFVFSTCSSVLTAPEVPPGNQHLSAAVEIGPLFDAIETLAPSAADQAFLAEAERKSEFLLQRTFTSGMMTALRRQFPDPADLSAYRESEKARMEALTLEGESKTPAWRDERDRVKASIERWRERLGWIERVSFSGCFTSEGLDFEVQAWPRRGGIAGSNP